MNSTNFAKQNPRLWSAVGRSFMILGILCNLAAVFLYYLPGLPNLPRPSTGNVYPIQNHSTVAYWTEAELWTNRALTAAFVFFCGFALFIAARLGLMKWRK
jgi:hypothetical protein